MARFLAFPTRGRSALPRELQPIAISVNLLMMRLKTALEAEREFASNSAHELRTPIAGALAQTQMLISELGDSANRHRAGQIEASLIKLSHLAEKLLQLSRAEAGIGISDRIMDLNQVLDMVLLDFWRSMSDPERLVLHRPEGPRLIGPFSEDAFAIVLRNLIENALLHGRKDEPVEVSLDGEGRVRRSCPTAWCSFGARLAFRTEPGTDQLAAGRLMRGSSLIVAMVSSVM